MLEHCVCLLFTLLVNSLPTDSETAELTAGLTAWFVVCLSAVAFAETFVTSMETAIMITSQQHCIHCIDPGHCHCYSLTHPFIHSGIHGYYCYIPFPSLLLGTHFLFYYMTIKERHPKHMCVCAGETLYETLIRLAPPPFPPPHRLTDASLSFSFFHFL